MKKSVIILSIFVILFISLVSATPYILFVNPTSADNYQTTGTSLTINSTITNISTLDEFIFNWDGTNYTFYDEDLVLMMNFENSSELGENDTFVRDLSKYGNNGSVINGAYISSGKNGGAYNFSNQEGIVINKSEEFDTNEYTISLWIKTRKSRIINFSVGDEHLCFIDQSRDAYCIGKNAYGQLGDGTTTNSELPVKVLGNHKFRDIAVTQYSSCGILTNDSVVCWGYNNRGQLGTGSTGGQSETPVFVDTPLNFTRLDSAHHIVCGYLTNGSVFCWGYGSVGQFGDGVSANRDVPTIVAPGYNFTQYAFGEAHTCGILYNGTCYCWGNNHQGERGDNSTLDTSVNVPVPVLGGNLTFKWISAGEDQNCGVLTNGSVMCWGENKEGEMGDGTTINRLIPTFSKTNYLFNRVFSSKHIQCGELINGSYACWGFPITGPSNYGDGSYNMYFVPKIVDWGMDFENIEGTLWNSPFTCGFFNESIYCWGGCSFGQNGLGYITTYFNFPIKLYLGEEFTDFNYRVYPSSTTTLLLLMNNGSVYGSGFNYYGNLGDNSTSLRTVPNPLFGNYTFSSIHPGISHVCGIQLNGSLLCWGENVYGQLANGSFNYQSQIPVPISGNYNFSYLAGGGDSIFGILQNGSIVSWGRNDYGQLGTGDLINKSTVQIVFENYNFTSIDPGNIHACGLLPNGSVMCWGGNNYGQLGLGGGNTTNMYTPQEVSGGHNFSFLDSTRNFNCGILQNGSALCWGLNSLGQLGMGNTTTMYGPQYVLGGHNFSSLALGIQGCCGLLQNGSVVCWGGNNAGQLGNGDLGNAKSIPVLISKDVLFSNLSNINSALTCGKTTNDKYYCWGRNLYGQLSLTASFPNTPFNFYYGELISQSQSTFKIGLTLNNSLRIISYMGFTDYQLNESEFSNIVLVSENDSFKTYLNGNLVSERDYDIIYQPSLNNLTIGKNTLSEIDELRVYNRSLSASEVSQLYKSNLKQVNSTSWEFYSTQTLSSDKTYSYTLFAKDGTGNIFGLLRRIIKYTLSSDDEDSSPGGIIPSYIVKEEKLQEGQSRQLKKGDKIKLEFSNQGSKNLEVVNVDVDVNIVKVKINEIEMNIENGTTQKIDVNGDGFYDLEVTVEEIFETGSSRLNFKEIHEEILGEEQESVQEEAKEETQEESGEVEEGKKCKWYWYVIGGVIILAIGGYLFFRFILRNFKRKK